MGGTKSEMCCEGGVGTPVSLLQLQYDQVSPPHLKPHVCPRCIPGCDQPRAMWATVGNDGGHWQLLSMAVMAREGT